MIRGREHLSLAVRRQDGSITHYSEPLSALYTGRVRRVPLFRGIVVLLETILLGLKALNKSANMALEDIQGEEEQEVSGWFMGGARFQGRAISSKTPAFAETRQEIRKAPAGDLRVQVLAPGPSER